MRGRGEKERARVEALERRVIHLSGALDDPSGWRGRDPGRARLERKALRWVLRILDSDSAKTLREIRDEVWAAELADRREAIES